MKLLDVELSEVRSALALVSEIVCPPFQTALLLMEQRAATEHLGGHLPTRLKGLDAALCGGVPFGVVTELVGPAGTGKTQFCLKLSLLAALPAHYGGLDGGVIYIDVESTFTSRRMIEMGASSFPEIFHSKGMAQEMAGRILVLQPTSLSEFTESLEKIKVSLLQNQVKLLVIDSMAALVPGVHEQRAPGQHPLSWHISLITSLAEFSRIPIVVTNRVRPQSHDESCLYPFQGFHWAHAVTIRLVLEAKSGQRFMKVEKSPTSPPLAFPFTITPSGLSLLTDDGTEMVVPETCNLSSR
ncbi:DNA repair protein RAD51 homolog 2 isoform X3 [Citrus sinensis]|uniref:DNA repair protein RAD51 homolog 2 isoform X3 n=1 Tax=Citrus sinensis TaxID=2711 RepID=UPI0022799A83|nr:DNA repair protein RAD51 homolog 2 isoform X3 [Citrus sinensis]